VVSAPSGTTILGNDVGTNYGGSGALPNALGGILVANGTTVGSTASGGGNRPSGNTGFGLRITAASVTVQANYVGTNLGLDQPPCPTAAAASRSRAVRRPASPSVARPAVRATSCPATPVRASRSTAAPPGVTAAANYIGLDSTGVTAVANSGEGVDISGAATGNSDRRHHDERPQLHCRQRFGRRGDPAERAPAGISVQGNWIGQNVSGLRRRPSKDSGVRIEAGSSGNTIGGLIETLPNAVQCDPRHRSAHRHLWGGDSRWRPAQAATGSPANSITGNAGLGI
jgi:hypothetical protein